MKTTRLKTSRLLAGLLALLLSAGCSAAGSYTENSRSVMKSESAVDSAAPSEEIQEYGIADAGSANAQADGAEVDWSSPADESAVIVYSADVTLQTRDYPEAWKKISSLISKYEGYIVSENLSNGNISDPEYRNSDETAQDEVSSAFYALKIPADSLDSFLDELSETGHVVSLSKNAENISKRYNDTKDQIEFLEKQNKRLLELLDEAKSLSDVLAIEEKQMEVEQQLRQYNEQLSDLNRDIEYSSVYLNIDKVDIYSPEQDGFGASLVYALKNTWMYLLRGLQILLLAVIYLIPWVLLAALLFFVIRALIKRRRKCEKPKNAAPANPQNKPETPAEDEMKKPEE